MFQNSHTLTQLWEGNYFRRQQSDIRAMCPSITDFIREAAVPYLAGLVSTGPLHLPSDFSIISHYRSQMSRHKCVQFLPVLPYHGISEVCQLLHFCQFIRTIYVNTAWLHPWMCLAAGWWTIRGGRRFVQVDLELQRFDSKIICHYLDMFQSVCVQDIVVLSTKRTVLTLALVFNWVMSGLDMYHQNFPNEQLRETEIMTWGKCTVLFL